MELRAIVFYGGDQKAARVVGVSVDVTERKPALAELRAFTEVLEEGIKARTRELEAEFAARTKAEESLRQAQKMEAVGLPAAWRTTSTTCSRSFSAAST